jgi:hypothetical protein
MLKPSLSLEARLNRIDGAGMQARPVISFVQEGETGSVPGRGMKRQRLDAVIVLEFGLASENPNVAR